jgi:hypothetical protein
LPAALERGGGAVPVPIAKGVIHAIKETRASIGAEGLANAFSTVAEVLADPEGLAAPKILANSEILPDPQTRAHPKTYSSAET